MHAWPFDGRSEELAQVRSAFHGTDVDVVVLAAPAGAGKTRLARHCLGELDCARTVWIGATRSAAAIPLGALAPLLLGGEPANSPLHALQIAMSRVAGWGGRRRVAMVVDDAHLLDNASATVIAQLVAQHLAFVLITVRTGEHMADALVRLIREGVGRYIELPPLPAPVMDRLIEYERPEGVSTREKQRLRELARGNPLALRELLHGAQPGGLTELVLSRLTGLDPDTRYAVELVACGEPVAVSIVERLAGLAAVTAAEDAGLIVVERSGARTQARLDHPLYGEVLRTTMRLSRSRRVYSDLADALLNTPLRRREDTILATVWQVEAGKLVRPDVIRDGAERAIAHHGLELAERLARAARDAEPGDDADRLLAEILAYRGRMAEAVELLPSVPPAEPADRARWAITRADAMYWSSGDIDAALTVLDSAAGEPTVEASRAWLLCFDARCADAVHVADHVLDDPDANPKGFIWAAAAGAAAAGFLGDIARTEEIIRRSTATARAHATSMPWGIVEVNVGACLGRLACGFPVVAESDILDGLRQAQAMAPAAIVGGWALSAGIVALARGHLTEADRLLAQALEGFATNDTYRLIRHCLAAQAAVAALSGDLAAVERLAQADALAHPANRLFAPWLETWRAWTRYVSGDLASATEAAGRAAEIARDAGMPGVEALALYDVVRLGGRPERARLAAISHELAEIAGRATHGMASRDGATDLEAAAHAFEERGYDLHAAEAFTTAAHRHRLCGRSAQADLALADAARLVTRFPQARTPLLQPDRLTSRLTRREREVLLLAADHTSAEIAERLNLALATVNNNLARAYTKLGITGRPELRVLLSSRRRGLRELA